MNSAACIINGFCSRSRIDSDEEVWVFMFNKALFREKRKIAKYTFIIFILLGVTYLAISLFIQTSTDKMQKNAVLFDEQRLIDVEKTIISQKINHLTSDVLYLADSLRFLDILDGDYSKIENQWLAFSNRKQIYDQVRFIDSDGNEVIRVNYDPDGAVIIPKSELQNKADRYYFTDTISLPKSQIYISKLDLNIENGEIEQPIKPMLRLGTPFFEINGKVKGVVILNYLAEDLLRQAEKISSTSRGSIFLLNSDGYWIMNNEDSGKEWAFMYEALADESFASYYPDEWKIIKSGGNGSLVTGNGVFCYTELLDERDLALYCDVDSMTSEMGDWYIVSFISPHSDLGRLFTDNILESTGKVIFKNSPVFFLLLLIAIVLALFATGNKIENDRVKYFSEYDNMTGVYNRRAGFERLNEAYKAISKTLCRISICFLDINGLKEVNDVLGHDAGDELIVSVVDGIKKSIREKDFVARLGGDEFLIIFEDMDEENAEAIWRRIVQKFEEINHEENREYAISVSHGIETLTCDANEHLDAVINRADEKMYQEKRVIKKDLIVVRRNETAPSQAGNEPFS